MSIHAIKFLSDLNGISLRTHNFTIMVLSDFTLKDVIGILNNIYRNPKLRTNPDHSYLLSQIEYYVQKTVIGDIHSRQNQLSHLKLSGSGKIAVWGGDLVPGCDICLNKSGLQTIRSVAECNLNCDFCYYYGEPKRSLLSEHYRIGSNTYTADDIKMMFEKQGEHVEGVAWVYYEPFVQFDKHPELIRFIHDLGIYQHIYTNGTLCTETQFKILADCGLEEIRFDIAASNISDKVLQNIKLAKKYIKYVCIESPMFESFYRRFKEKKKQILDCGVNQINFAELHLKPQHKSYLDADIYRYKYGYISTIDSRQLTYDIIELAEQESWDNITLHDCSNETKFFRSFNKQGKLGETSWSSEMNLPLDWYYNAIQKYDTFKNILKQPADNGNTLLEEGLIKSLIPDKYTVSTYFTSENSLFQLVNGQSSTLEIKYSADKEEDLLGHMLSLSRGLVGDNTITKNNPILSLAGEQCACDLTFWDPKGKAVSYESIREQSIHSVNVCPKSAGEWQTYSLLTAIKSLVRHTVLSETVDLDVIPQRTLVGSYTYTKIKNLERSKGVEMQLLKLESILDLPLGGVLLRSYCGKYLILEIFYLDDFDNQLNLLLNRLEDETFFNSHKIPVMEVNNPQLLDVQRNESEISERAQIPRRKMPSKASELAERLLNRKYTFFQRHDQLGAMKVCHTIIKGHKQLTSSVPTWTSMIKTMADFGNASVNEKIGLRDSLVRYYELGLALQWNEILPWTMNTDIQEMEMPLFISMLAYHTGDLKQAIVFIDEFIIRYTNAERSPKLAGEHLVYIKCTKEFLKQLESGKSIADIKVLLVSYFGSEVVNEVIEDIKDADKIFQHYKLPMYDIVAEQKDEVRFAKDIFEDINVCLESKLSVAHPGHLTIS